MTDALPDRDRRAALRPAEEPTPPYPDGATITVDQAESTDRLPAGTRGTVRHCSYLGLQDGQPAWLVDVAWQGIPDHVALEVPRDRARQEPDRIPARLDAGRGRAGQPWALMLRRLDRPSGMVLRCFDERPTERDRQETIEAAQRERARRKVVGIDPEAVVLARWDAVRGRYYQEPAEGRGAA